MQIKEIKSKSQWDNFLNRKKMENYPLFQSWNWGEVQKKIGFNILRLGMYDFEKNELIAVCQIIEIKARRGQYLHLRHGPVFLKFNSKYFDYFINEIKKIANERGASFIRVSPLIKKEEIEKNFFKKRKLIPSPIHNQDAETCWVLSIERKEEELLKEMRKTHRYLIRKAQNMNIKIIRTQKVSEIDKFLPLYKELSQKRGFVPHKGIKEEFEILEKDDQVVLFLAQYEKKIISGALIIFIGDLAIYHHSASLEEYKNIPSSYLIQWEAIKEAKKRGKKLYNFWGIAPDNKPNHPWKGLTLFKSGFGGEKIEFIHAHDLPLNYKYYKTYFIELITKLRKGY